MSKGELPFQEQMLLLLPPPQLNKSQRKHPSPPSALEHSRVLIVPSLPYDPLYQRCLHRGLHALLLA